MSKSMVAMNTGSQDELVALKQGRKELVSQDAISSWLEEAQSGKSLLAPVIPSTVDGSQLKLDTQEMSTGMISGYAITVGSQGAVFGLIGSWIANAALASHSSLSGWSVLSIAAAGAGLFGGGSFLLMRFGNKKGKLLWDTCLRIQSEGLRPWLQTRYQVKVVNEVLTAIAEGMLQGKKAISFSDADKHNWILRLAKNKHSYQLEPAPIDAKTDVQVTSLQQAPVKIVVGTSSLPATAQTVIDSIDTRLSQLHKFALSTEQSHVVARTVEDAREAVAAFERLDALGAGESGLERLVSILGLLDGELEKIVQVRIAEESVGFAARQKSVEARVSGVGV